MSDLPPPRRAPAPIVLAAGDELLEAAVAAGAPRWAAYVIDPPALVIGSAQALETIDQEAATRAGLAVVRRGTGGGAVRLDGAVLQVDVAAPLGSHPLAVADIVEAYRPLGEAWVAALATVGIEARCVATAEARTATDLQRAAARVACWAGRSPYEVLDREGNKLVGLAQRRRRGGVLHESAVYCAGSPAGVGELLAVAAATATAVELGLGTTTWLGALAPGLHSPEAAWAQIGPTLLEAVAIRS